MKILVCGPRRWVNPKPIEEVLRAFPRGTILVHGDAAGVDSIAGWLGEQLGFEVRPYAVDHLLDGPWPAAGPIRNGRMLASEHPHTDGSFIEVGIAFVPPTGLTTGTGNMAVRMRHARPAIDVREIVGKPR